MTTNALRDPFALCYCGYETPLYARDAALVPVTVHAHRSVLLALLSGELCWPSTETACESLTLALAPGWPLAGRVCLHLHKAKKHGMED